jgi:hypothetical protein
MVLHGFLVYVHDHFPFLAFLILLGIAFRDQACTGSFCMDMNKNTSFLQVSQENTIFMS